MTHEEYTNKNQEKLFAALVNFVAETKDVHADSTNPFHKSKYASLGAHLASIKPIAAKHGLAIVQMPYGEGSSVGIKTIVIHKEGGSLESYALIPATSTMKGQEAGAIYSYLRRYALASIAGVATDDDDAEFDRVSRGESAPAYQAPKSAAPAAPAKKAFAPPADADDIVVPFGKNKGTRLSELDDYNLNWWANTWEPKPWEKTGKVGPKDLALKSAAVKLWNDRQNKTANEAEEGSFDDIVGDDVPF